VERIIKHRRNKGRIQYMIKWEGYSMEECTWEYEENLTNCPEILENYKKSMEENNSAPKKKGRPSKKARVIDDESPHVSPPSMESSSSDAKAEENKSPDVDNTDGEKDTDDDYVSADDHLPDMESTESSETEETTGDEGTETTCDADESSMNSSVSSSAAQTGWDRGLEAKKVIGVTRYPDNSLWVLISWQNAELAPELVPSQIANEKCPALMIEYYEKHLQWKTYSGNNKKG